MFRAISAISLETPALEVLASVARRRDISKVIRIKRFSSSAHSGQTVITSESRRAEVAATCDAPPLDSSPPPPPREEAPPEAPRRVWAITAAVAAAASLGGAYFYKKLTEDVRPKEAPSGPVVAPPEPPPAYPTSGADLPRHVQFLLVGGGTASFAAMRAIRAARPEAAVLLVGDEPLPPYMRPPLSKEMWRESALSTADTDLPALSFKQWNGKRRPLLYEPLAFYTPVDKVAESGGGAAAARGWRVTRLDIVKHEAELHAPGRDPVTVSYDKCLVATGVKPRRLETLRAARDAGRAVAVRDARDAAKLARLVDAPETKHVVLVGGGFLATELAAALAERLSADGKQVTQIFREQRLLEEVLPPYLAEDAARRLRTAGVDLIPAAELVRATPAPDNSEVELIVRGADGKESVVNADVVVECVGAELDPTLAKASGLEVVNGALAVNAELQARADVWAAGDAASWHDTVLGRRRLEHHDHAVASGRRAGENMAGVAPQRPYTHQPMFWSDLGPDLGYEAIGLVDSRLSTVGVFSAEDVKDASVSVSAGGEGAAPREPLEAGAAGEAARRYERGVVFYTREKRVVGILLWNLFNRMHVARQVLALGEFEDLFEVAKLFSLHEED